jgi:hypothetical protein
MGVEFGGIEKLFVELIDRVCDGVDLYTTRSRAGIFSPALTMWLSVNCWAKGSRGLTAAIAGMADGETAEVMSRNPETRKGRITEISNNSGGLSRARQRLDMGGVKELTRKMNKLLVQEKAPEVLWHGRRVYLFDGTVVTLTRTDKILKQFKPIRNQHGEAYTAHD